MIRKFLLNHQFEKNIILRHQSSTVPLSQFGGVHGTNRTVGGTGSAKLWRNKPLLKRGGDKIFKTGLEATQLLIGEAARKDSLSPEFMFSWESMATSLSVVFDRMPKYAWVMKQLLEPERTITFRVAWLDDTGVSRVNRGYRVQYSSALGPYEGGLSFSEDVNLSTMKAAAFDSTFSNALSRVNLGGAYGGADFVPFNKSETEIQRFCQSYMTELSKYIGPDTDLPGMGDGVTAAETGYLYGQYKRLNDHYGQLGKGLLWGGAPTYFSAQGYGAVQFAKYMLKDKDISLEGKRCIVTGSHYVALAVAEKLIEFGAIPVTFSDSSGFIYEPTGFDSAKLKTIKKIKSERGARVGRYIIASTSAQFNDPESIFDIPCDLIFSCSKYNIINEAAVTKLSNKGCKGIIECTNQTVDSAGIVAMKKRNMLHGPYRAATCGAGLVNGLSLEQNEELIKQKGFDSYIDEGMRNIYEEVKATAKEFNTRGDLNAGTNIASFIRVADVMVTHGSV